ncbi:MAG: hypothetical protein ACWGO1_09995, partial [Anaerolineales bacterium]
MRAWVENCAQLAGSGGRHGLGEVARRDAARRQSQRAQRRRQALREERARRHRAHERRQVEAEHRRDGVRLLALALSA